MDETAFSHGKRVEFGRRRVAPRVCIIDSKPYIRTFLAETFEDLGFISTQHADAADMTPVLGEITPDLVLLAIAGGDTNAEDVLKTLATTAFRGNVILLGAPDSPALVELQRLGKRSGLPMLPALTTPFRTKELAEKLAGLLPVTTTRSMPVDLVDALDNDWLELHYQPLVDPRSLTVCPARA